MFLFVLALTRRDLTREIHGLMITIKDNISGGAAIEQVSLSYPSLYAVFTVDGKPFGHISLQQSCAPNRRHYLQTLELG